MEIKTKGLSEKHKKVLDFLIAYQTEFNYPPTIREIGENTGISSTSVVNYYLSQLERMGYIEREKRTNRGLEITKRKIPDKRSLKAILCHSSNDKQAVHNLFKKLVRDGVDAWLDKEKILPGQNWELEIKNALFDADVIVVCVSKESVSK